MSYDDAKWYTDINVTLAEVNGTFGAVASAGVGTVAGVESKTYRALQAMNLKGGTLTVLVAPDADFQPMTAAIMNGTTTMATAAITTLTAGQTVALTTGATLGVVAGDAVTVNVYGTATATQAAGAVTGTLDIELAFTRQFA